MASPTAAKTAEKVADNNSFTTVANQWFEHWRDGKSSRHINSTRRRLDTNIFPSLGMLQTAKIKAPDVVAMVKVIEARGAHDIAKRAMGTTGQIFRFAIAHGYAKRNPAAVSIPVTFLEQPGRSTMPGSKRRDYLIFSDRSKPIRELALLG